MSDETTFNPVERMLKRKLDKGETLRPDEWEDWYEYHPELKPDEIVIEDDLVPEIDLAPRLEDDLQPVLDGIDILDAYARWSGKNYQPNIGSKRESIMIRCPNPAHNDANPSAWINLDKQTWYCGACGVGSDKYGIAAYNFGYDVPGFQGAVFPDLRKAMCEEFGVSIRRNPAGKYEVATYADPELIVEEEPEPKPAILRIVKEDDEDDSTAPPKLLPWEECCTADTFLDAFMTAVVPLHIVPEEYVWFEGMMAVGLAAGHNAYIADFTNIYLNMLLVLYGRSGIRKTTSAKLLEKLIQQAIPWNGSATAGSLGVVHLPSPGSPEALFDSFLHNITDGAGTIIDRAPIRGYLYIDELSGFIAKSNRPGASFKEQMIELFDKTESELSYKTKKGGVETIAPPFLSSIATTQPKAIHAFLTKNDIFSGFLNRWDIAFGHQPDNEESFTEPPDLTEAVERLKNIHAWATNKRELQLTPEARTAFNEFIRAVLKPLRDKADNEILTRLDLKCKKYLGVFAVNEKRTDIIESDVDKVRAMFPYIARSCALLSRDISFNEVDDCINKSMQKIKDYTAQHGKGPTRRELNMRLRGSGYTRETIEKTIKHIETFDLVDMPQDGRTKRYRIHA